MGAAAACRPEEPLELHWDEVCALSTTEPATLACYEPKRRDLNLKPRRGHRCDRRWRGSIPHPLEYHDPMAAPLTSHKPHVFTSCCGYPMRNLF